MDYTAAPYSDRCDMNGCLYNPNSVEAPAKVFLVDGGYVANYLCRHCGNEWATSWMANGYGDLADRQMRALAETTHEAGLPMLLPGGRRYPVKRSA